MERLEETPDGEVLDGAVNRGRSASFSRTLRLFTASALAKSWHSKTTFASSRRRTRWNTCALRLNGILPMLSFSKVNF